MKGEGTEFASWLVVMVPRLLCVLLKPCGNIIMHFYDTSVWVFTCTFMRSCTIPQVVPFSFSHTYTYTLPGSLFSTLNLFFSHLQICSLIAAEKRRRRKELRV